MAQVDSRIAMGVQPLDAGASIGRGYQLRDLAAQSEARTLDTQMKQQALKKQGTIADLHRLNTQDGKLNRAGLSQGMADAGYGADTASMQKQWGENDKAEQEYWTKNVDRTIKTLEYSNKAMASLRGDPGVTPDKVRGVIHNMVAMGLMDANQGAQAAREIPDDPRQIPMYLEQKLAQSLPAEQAAKLFQQDIQAQNLGGHTQMVDMNPRTNPGIVGQAYQRTQTPGEIESARHNQLTEGTALGQLGVARDRLAFDQQQPKGQVVDTPNGMMLVDPRTGRASPVQAPSGGQLVGKAGEAEATRKREAAEALSLVDKAEELLKGGATGSYAGAAWDAAIGTFGISNKGGEAAAQLKALEGALVSKMPKMSGPQSDKDVAMYKQMAATIGDSTVPVGQRLAALKVVREIQERYAGTAAGGAEGVQQPAPGGVLSPQSAQRPQQSGALEMAKQAIAQGADRAAVMQRLRSMGIDPKGLENGNDSRTGSW